MSGGEIIRPAEDEPLPERILAEVRRLAMSESQKTPPPPPPPQPPQSFWQKHSVVILGALLSAAWGYTALQISAGREDQRAAVAKQEASAMALDARLGTMQAAIGDNRFKTDQTAREASATAGQVGQLTARLEAGQGQRIENDRIFDGKLAKLDNRLSVMETKIDILLREARREGGVPFGERQMGPMMGDRLMPIPASAALSPIVRLLSRT